MDDQTNPFAPLTDIERSVSVGKASISARNWHPQLPAPCDPPGLEFAPPWKGLRASRRSVYRALDGSPLFGVYRYLTDDNAKVDIPYTFGRLLWTDESGRSHDEDGWRFKRPNTPVPLYGLERLNAKPDATVLIVEGEKTVDAASELFPDHVAITSQGGSNNSHHADWTVLQGRRAVIWPDNDHPGRDYARKVSQALERIAIKVMCVAVPSEWPAKWDLADQAPNDTDLRRLLDSATDMSPRHELPHGFSMNEKGLWYESGGAEESSAKANRVWLCPPLTIVCETDDGDGNGHSVVFQWRDGRGRLHQRVILRSESDPQSKFLYKLMDEGLRCAGTRDAMSHLRCFFGTVQSSDWRRTVSRTGWHEVGGQRCFVLSNTEAIGPSRHQVILGADVIHSEALYAGEGTLQEWQENVASFAIGNSRIACFISTAFASPLLDVLCEDSGGVHLLGNSQSGKSTALAAAASVWGKGAVDNGFVRTWRTTGNAIEGIAAAHSGTFLPLDEIGSVNGREVGEIIYSLANGSGKARSDRTGATRTVKTWKLIFCSTGEVSLATKMTEHGMRTMAGQEIRLVTLPADAGAGFGVFEELHDRNNGADLSTHLKKMAATHFGTAGRAYLHALTAELSEEPNALRLEVTELIEKFIQLNVPAGSDGQVVSVARRFGLFAAAGELATFYKVLPWPDGEATSAAATCFQAWLDLRGGERPSEDMQAVAAVRLFVELHGTSRFTTIGQDPFEQTLSSEPNWVEDRPISNRAGWRKKEGGEWVYMFSAEVWKTEVCKGLQHENVSRGLARRGYLIHDEGRLTKQQRIPDEGRFRLATVRGSIVGELV